LAVKNGTQQILVNQAVKLDLLLETVAGHVQLRDVETLIIDGKMEEYILGNDVLLQLGVNVEQLITQCAGRMIHMDQEQARTKKDFEEHDIPVGPYVQADIDEALEKMLTNSEAMGASVIQVAKLRKLVYTYKDIWRTKLGPDPPAKVPPLKIRFKNKYKPIRFKGRRYTPLQSEFLKRRAQELEKFKYIYKNINARGASPVHMVKKLDNPTSENLDDAFRWTGDYRLLNENTEPLIWPMPHLEVVAQKVRGCKYFQSFDAFKGFWQLPLSEESQEHFSFITDEGVYTPTRVPQGCSDAVMYFQHTMQKIFEEQFNKTLLLWLDDILSYSTTFEELLKNTQFVFEQCRKYGLFLNANKTCLYAEEIKFCGKILNEEGVKHDPKRTEALAQMAEPETAAELQQFICALNWVSNSIPDFARNCKSLRDKLETICTRIGKRTKKSLINIPITLDKDEKESFEYLKQQVKETLILSHPDPDAEFGLFCDASDGGWGSMLFQIRDYDPVIPWCEQKCEPLYCLGGVFRGSSINWKIIEKEAYAIKESIERLDYLLHRAKGFRIFTDHRNLVYIFSTDKTGKKMTSDKLERWAMYLSGYKYTIEHIAGEQNVWADLLSRWAIPNENIRLRRFHIPLHPFAPGKDFIWPDLEVIKSSQTKHKLEQRQDLTYRDGLYYQMTQPNRVWIPEKDKELQMRLKIIAHFGSAGHRGIANTLKKLTQYCYWTDMTSSVRNFCRRCLHCLQSRGGKVTPRPLGEQIHAQEPNRVLHFDYTKMVKAYNGYEYVLVIKDDYSHLVHLVPTTSPNAEIVAKALLDWFAEYRVVEQWVSDQGSHFKNQVMEHLSKLLQTNHHFTTAYCPWANGTVERVNRDLLATIKAILNETQRSLEEWPNVLTLVAFVLNHSAVDSLGGKSPVEIHSGTKPSNPLDAIFDHVKEMVVACPTNTEIINRNFEGLKTSMQHMHKNCDIAKDIKKKANRRPVKHPRQPRMPNFEIGDYVLWARVDDKFDHGKLQVNWRGPFRIADTRSDYVYVIEHLLTGDKRIVHCTRLKYYEDKSLHVSEELKSHISQQGMVFTTGPLKGLRYNNANKKWEILTSWEGFEGIDDSWEPFETLIQDIPRKVIEYLNGYRSENPQQVKNLSKRYSKLIATVAKKHSYDISSLLCT
jgi:transposase InsO family protein